MSIAGERVRSFVERIERLKAEQDELTELIRDVYAEAKGEGYDKTALGDIVSMRRKKAKNPTAFESRSDNFDLYLAAIEEAELTASHTHAPAREAA